MWGAAYVLDPYLLPDWRRHVSVHRRRYRRRYFLRVCGSQQPSRSPLLYNKLPSSQCLHPARCLRRPLRQLRSGLRLLLPLRQFRFRLLLQLRLPRRLRTCTAS